MMSQWRGFREGREREFADFTFAHALGRSPNSHASRTLRLAQVASLELKLQELELEEVAEQEESEHHKESGRLLRF